MEAVAGSLNYIASRSPAETVRLGDELYTMEWLRASLSLFMQLAEKHPDARELARQVKEQFVLYRATGMYGDGGMLITGYYEPLAVGRLTPEPPFLHPLYGLPVDLVKQGDGSGRVCRRQGEELLPYWTRRQIEGGQLLSGQEIVWLADPIEAYLFHIQGSGRVQIAEGGIKRIHYAGNNGHPYTGVGQILIREGKLIREKTTLPAIIDYLHQHPEEQERLLQENDRFIFFKWDSDAADGGPLGSIGEPLTAGRSIALDPGCFPAGALGFLQTREPMVNGGGEIIGYSPVARFVTNQDKGAAIRGPGRVDMFMGTGKRAMAAAGVMKNPGTLYVLVKRATKLKAELL